MSQPWHGEIRPEEQEKFVVYATSLVANHEFFNNNPKFPKETVEQIALYFVTQAWNSSLTKTDFFNELANIPHRAEMHYRPQPTQQVTVQNQHPTTQTTGHHSNQQTQQQPVNETQLFWETFIGIIKNKQECDRLRQDYALAKQLLEKFKEKKNKFIKILKYSDAEKKVQQLEIITKNLKQYFHDHQNNYHAFMEKNKDETAALANLVNTSPIKRFKDEIEVLKKLNTIVQNLASKYESLSKDLKNKQTEHTTILKDLSENSQQCEKVMASLCETVHRVVGFPSFDDFILTNQPNKRKIVDIYQSLQPNKLRKFEEDLFPMKNFMKQVLLGPTSNSSQTFYDALQEYLTTSLASRFSIAFKNVKSKFEIDIRHFPRISYGTNQDNIDEDEQSCNTSKLTSPISISSVSELSCATNLTDLQNVTAFQETDNSKQFVIEISLYAKVQDETKTGFLQLYLCPPMRIHVNFTQTSIDLIEPVIDFSTEGMENSKAKQYTTINTSINTESGRLLLLDPLQIPFVKENVMRYLNQDDPTPVKVQCLLSSYVESALFCIDSVSISE